MPVTNRLPDARRLTPDEDPGGLAASFQLTLAALLTALGVADVVQAKWLLAVQALVGFAAVLWARAKAWPPAKVWLETLQARSQGDAGQTWLPGLLVAVVFFLLGVLSAKAGLI